MPGMCLMANLNIATSRTESPGTQSFYAVWNVCRTKKPENFDRLLGIEHSK